MIKARELAADIRHEVPTVRLVAAVCAVLAQRGQTGVDGLSMSPNPSRRPVRTF
jgi:hypothetical protein